MTETFEEYAKTVEAEVRSKYMLPADTQMSEDVRQQWLALLCRIWEADRSLRR